MSRSPSLKRDHDSIFVNKLYPAKSARLATDSSSVGPSSSYCASSIIPGSHTSADVPTVQQPTSHLVKTDPTNFEQSDSNDSEPIIAWSADQRLVNPNQDEPECIICGKYGEYINDDTENDVCSLECKRIDTSKYGNKRSISAKKASHKDIDNIVTHPSIADNIHAKLTNYTESNDISTMPSSQVEAMRKAHDIVVKGASIPKPIATFTQCQNTLGSTLLHNLESMGWSMATGIQRQAVPAGLCGRDIYAIAPTNSGKTGAFLIPIVAHCQSLAEFYRYKRRSGPFALILAPTRELCQQIEETAKQLIQGIANTRTALLIGGQPLPNQLYRLKRGSQILIGTPGRVVDIITYHAHILRPWKLQMVVVDEADAMFSLGFHHQIRQIFGKLNDNTLRQTSFFSATNSNQQEMEKLSRKLISPITILVEQPSGKPGKPLAEPTSMVRQTILWVENSSKAKRLLSILNDPKYFAPPVLIFVDSRLGAEFLSRTIAKRNKVLRVVAMHADKPQAERASIVAGINDQEPQWDVIVSTDILARGLDLPCVRLVINYDMAPTVEDYVHRIGRAVIHGPLAKHHQHQRGRAITFINNEHKHLFEPFTRMLSNRSLAGVTPLPVQLKRFL
ncbi:P-loop containing nucleoside triphosphate hydrolase protein [Radiomyces spectabilis]|uniref:P-loop containing nucleoside triphosphate hydrolase protein n=1 Tax=Radiomyces spectabilis TaxID=64574 RepID=UPI00221F6961|nr:P-loop containing nucleoside triphosphate hydrolase protein [Radiomyces spectabilis]KAI8388169.1 P-loop containing nucleoside triphosphate hydrolase protein [Radiomyces spectabilis]